MNETRLALGLGALILAPFLGVALLVELRTAPTAPVEPAPLEGVGVEAEAGLELTAAFEPIDEVMDGAMDEAVAGPGDEPAPLAYPIDALWVAPGLAPRAR